MTSTTQTDPSPYIERICTEFGVSRDELIGHGKKQAVSAPRKLLMAALRSQGWQLQQIGALLSNRHHSTVIAGIKDMRKRIDSSAALQSIYKRVTLGENHPTE